MSHVMLPGSLSDKTKDPRAAHGPRRVRIRELSTGRVFDAWAVDAREMLNHPKGGFEAVPATIPLRIHTTDAPPPSAVPLTPPTTIDLLGAKSYKELQALAKRAGLNAGGTKDALVASLLPLIEAGTVSLEELPVIQPDPVQFPHATVE